MDDRAATRINVSRRCAAAGVLLLALASVLPSDWLPIAPLFAGLALLAISHVLTPCQDQITRWWRRIITRGQDDAGSLHR